MLQGGYLWNELIKRCWARSRELELGMKPGQLLWGSSHAACSRQLPLNWSLPQSFQDDFSAWQFICYPKVWINSMTAWLLSKCSGIRRVCMGCYNVQIWILSVRSKHFHNEVILFQNAEFGTQKWYLWVFPSNVPISEEPTYQCCIQTWLLGTEMTGNC